MNTVDALKTVIRNECSKVMSRKDLDNLVLKKIGEPSVASVVYTLNGKIVAKASQYNVFFRPLINNRKQVWKKFNEIIIGAHLNKETLTEFLPLPLFYKDISLNGDDYFLSFEPLIKGKSLSFFLKDAVFCKDHLPKLLFILYDILLWLGDKYSFNHNDLHENNVMVVRYAQQSYTSLCIKDEPGRLRQIDDVKYFPVLIDFDWSTFRSVNATHDEYIKNLISYEQQQQQLSMFSKVHADYSLPYYSISSWSPSVDVAFLMQRINELHAPTTDRIKGFCSKRIYDGAFSKALKTNILPNVEGILAESTPELVKQYNIFILMQILSEILLMSTQTSGGKKRVRKNISNK